MDVINLLNWKTVTLMMAVLSVGDFLAGCSEAITNTSHLAATGLDSAGNANTWGNQKQSEKSEAAASIDETWFGYKHWLASCDNLRSCTAFGADMLGDNEWRDTRIIVRVTREGTASSMPELMILISDDDVDAPPAGTTAQILVDGPTEFKHNVRFSSDSEYDDVYVIARFSSSDARRIITAIAQGNSLTVNAPGKSPIILLLDGSLAVFRWMDKKQMRAGGVTALVDYGPALPQAIPPIPRVPIVKYYQLPPQNILLKTVPAIVLETKEAKACAEKAGPDYDLPEAELSAYIEAAMNELKQHSSVVARLTPDLLLVSMPCGSGAYNYKDRFFLVSESEVRGLGLDSESPEEADTLLNISFDPITAELNTFSKGSGVGDCGVFETFVWDGTTFQLTQVKEMPECIGIHPGLWHVTYRAVVK